MRKVSRFAIGVVSIGVQFEKSAFRAVIWTITSRTFAFITRSASPRSESIACNTARMWPGLFWAMFEHANQVRSAQRRRQENALGRDASVHRTGRTAPAGQQAMTMGEASSGQVDTWARELAMLGKTLVSYPEKICRARNLPAREYDNVYRRKCCRDRGHLTVLRPGFETLGWAYSGGSRSAVVF